MELRRLLELAERAEKLATENPKTDPEVQRWRAACRGVWEAYTRNRVIDIAVRDLVAPEDLGELATASENLANQVINSNSFDPTALTAGVSSLRRIAAAFRSTADRIGPSGPVILPLAKDELAPGWRLLRPLVPDGQGEVFLVERFPDHAKGVLKRLPLGKQENAKAVERLRVEIEVTQKLRHPCIVTVLDRSLADAGNLWFVTEWMPFKSLADEQVLSVFKGDVWRTLRVARDIATALIAAHEKGVIHRDVKPGNILLRDLDRPALADFGIAHVNDAVGPTGTKEQVGPRWFSPPEIDLGRIEPTKAFDVYSLGKVIYYTLTGGGRFIQQAFREGPRNLITIFERPEFEHVNELLDKMICVKIGDRFQSQGKRQRRRTRAPPASAPTRPTPCARNARCARCSGHGARSACAQAPAGASSSH